MQIVDRSSDLPLTTETSRAEGLVLQRQLLEELVAAVDAQLGPALRSPWREVRIQRDSAGSDTFEVEVRY